MLAAARSLIRQAPKRWRRAPGRTLLIAGGGITAAGALATGLGLYPGPTLVAVASASAISAVFAWRVARGGAGLPSGPMRPLQPGYFEDGVFLQALKQRFGPVFSIRPRLRPIVCIADLTTANRFLSDHAVDLETPATLFNHLIDGGFLRSMRGRQHRHYRTMLSRALSRRVLQRRGGELSDIVRRHVTDMIETSDLQPKIGMDPRPFLEGLVFDCWGLLFFGLGPEDPKSAVLKFESSILDRHRLGTVTDRRARASLASIRATVLGSGSVAGGSRPPGVGPRDDFLAELLNLERASVDGQTALDNLIYIFNNSLRDFIGLCVWILKMLSDHPQWAKAVREDPGGVDEAVPGLARCVVLETLRLRQSEYLWRRTLKDTAFEGHRLPQGTPVRICVRECHRSETAFARPLCFDPERFRPAGVDAELFKPFGMRDHTCIGQGLTLTVAELLVSELCRERDWVTVADGATRFGVLGGHWEPTGRYRVRADATESEPARGSAAQRQR